MIRGVQPAVRGSTDVCTSSVSLLCYRGNSSHDKYDQLEISSHEQLRQPSADTFDTLTAVPECDSMHRRLC